MVYPIIDSDIFQTNKMKKNNNPKSIESYEEFIKIYGHLEHPKEVDVSYMPNNYNMSLEEKIEYIESLFDFVEDTTVMKKLIKELKQNKTR